MSPASKSGLIELRPKAKTYYEMAGPEQGQPVVLVHGFSVPSCVWNGTFEHLAQAGFRVVRYDLYGRGRSSRPLDCDYGLQCYVDQLQALVEKLELKRHLGVVGLSMGGPIAAAYAARYPHHIRAVVLIDPVVTGVNGGWAMRLASLPTLGEMLLRLLGKKLLTLRLRGDFSRPERMPSSLPARYRAFMDGGFFRAIHLTLRSGMLGDHTEVYRGLAERVLPTLVIWGEADATVPIEQAEILQKILPHARLEVIADAAHLPHLEHPEEVNPILSSFLLP